MIHVSYKPTFPLCDFVEDVWLYDDYTPRHFKERILPTGTIELVINLRDDELRIYDPVHIDSCTRFPEAVVSGAYGRGFVIDTAEETSMVGVHFKPGGAFPFLGLPAGELANTHVDLKTLWGPPARRLREQLCAAATPADRFCVLKEALSAHLSRSLEHHGAVPIVLRAFRQAGASAKVRDVARQVGLSQRRFIEVFTAEVGMTPKLFSRVQRFQRVLVLAQRATAPDWAQLAVDGGYFDQSHLIHDFQMFSGLTPACYLERQRSLQQQGVHLRRHHLPLTG